jgi:hypothetical protein
MAGARAGQAAVCALILCACGLAVGACGQSSTPKAPSTAGSTAGRSTKSATRKSAPPHPVVSKSAGKSQAAKSTSAHPSKSSRKTKVGRARGQQKIDGERATSIQQALIREHYLTGEPTGTWNQASEDAMRRYQGDHSWQTKQVPDSRALIKLGLGPSNDHLLNPESAMTTGPDAPRSESPAPASRAASPAVPASGQSPTQSDPPGPQ